MDDIAAIPHGIKRAALGFAVFVAVFVASLTMFAPAGQAQCLCNCYRVEPEMECVTALAKCAAETAAATSAQAATDAAKNAVAIAAGLPPPGIDVIAYATIAANTTKCLVEALGKCAKRGGVGGCLCSPFGHLIIQAVIRWQHEVTRDHIMEEMVKHKNFWANDFFNDYVYKALLGMTHELTAMGMHQVAVVGAMLDAQNQIRTQRLMQQLSAEAHKDYQPSADMCTFGTAARGLASAERRAQGVALTLTGRSQDRQLGNLNTAAAVSFAADRTARLRQFKQRYCNAQDNDNGLSGVCIPGGPTPATINRDIDYTRTLGLARTLNVDMTDNVLTGDEQDIMAMSSYLYANVIPNRPSEAILKVPANQDEFLDWRSVVAKRSVAENSFNAIVGMKSAGSEAVNSNSRYVQAVLTQLGVSPAEARAMLGTNPSYYALMEVLSQRIYQSPEFYTNLYDKPANVERKDAAMQAIDLMLDHDSYRSELRYESMLAVLLEMEIMKYQESVQNRLNSLEERGRRN